MAITDIESREVEMGDSASHVVAPRVLPRAAVVTGLALSPCRRNREVCLDQRGADLHERRPLLRGAAARDGKQHAQDQ
jgi:hypothetical protein